MRERELYAVRIKERVSATKVRVSYPARRTPGPNGRRGPGCLHPRVAGAPQAPGGLATCGLTAALLSPDSDSHLTERVLARSLSHL
jgi:hypothetical protein